MAVGGRDSYFLKGASPEESGNSLEEALSELLQFWYSVPGLRRLTPGNLSISLSIGAARVDLEITEASAIDRFMGVEGPMAILRELAHSMHLPLQDAIELLNEAQATVRVDTIQDPGAPTAWRSGEAQTPSGKIQGADDASVVLPKATGAFLGELLAETERSVRRAPGRPRTGRARELLDQIVAYGQAAKLSPRRLSGLTGVPESTLGDAYRRLAPKPSLPKVFQGRKARARVTKPQVQVVQQELAKEKNAAKVARQLGLPPRTVREIRARLQAPRPERSLGRVVSPTTGRRSYSSSDQAELLRTVREQKLTAAEAGRKLGVPARTARRWVRSARLKGGS